MLKNVPMPLSSHNYFYNHYFLRLCFFCVYITGNWAFRITINSSMSILCMLFVCVCFSLYDSVFFFFKIHVCNSTENALVPS